MVVCVTIMYLFVRSKYGRTVQAIREDYIAASASGINVTYYKVMTFAISAFFAGIGGGIYAHYMTAMIPTNFNFNYSAEVEHGGFACAVGADQPHQLGFADFHIKIIHGFQAAKLDAKVLAFQNGLCHGSGPLFCFCFYRDGCRYP